MGRTSLSNTARPDTASSSASTPITEEEKTFNFGEGGTYNRLRAKFLHLFAHTELRYKDPDTFFHCNSFFRSQPHGFLTHYVDGVLKITPLNKEHIGITISETDSVLAGRFITAAYEAAKEYTDPGRKIQKEDHEKIFVGGSAGPDEDTVDESPDMEDILDKLEKKAAKIRYLMFHNESENARFGTIWALAVTIMSRVETIYQSVTPTVPIRNGHIPTNGQLQYIRDVVQSAFRENTDIGFDKKTSQYVMDLPSNSDDILSFFIVADVIMAELVKFCESGNSHDPNINRNEISRGLQLQKNVEIILGLQSYTPPSTVEALEQKLNEIRDILDQIVKISKTSQRCNRIIATYKELLGIRQDVQQSQQQFGKLYLELMTDLEAKGKSTAAKYIDECIEMIREMDTKKVDTLTVDEWKQVHNAYHMCCEVNAIFPTENGKDLKGMTALYKQLQDKLHQQLDTQIKANTSLTNELQILNNEAYGLHVQLTQTTTDLAEAKELARKAESNGQKWLQALDSKDIELRNTIHLLEQEKRKGESNKTTLLWYAEVQNKLETDLKIVTNERNTARALKYAANLTKQKLEMDVQRKDMELEVQKQQLSKNEDDLKEAEAKLQQQIELCKENDAKLSAQEEELNLRKKETVELIIAKVKSEEAAADLKVKMELELATAQAALQEANSNMELANTREKEATEASEKAKASEVAANAEVAAAKEAAEAAEKQAEEKLRLATEKVASTEAKAKDAIEKADKAKEQEVETAKASEAQAKAEAAAAKAAADATENQSKEELRVANEKVVSAEAKAKAAVEKAVRARADEQEAQKQTEKAKEEANQNAQLLNIARVELSEVKKASAIIDERLNIAQKETEESKKSLEGLRDDLQAATQKQKDAESQLKTSVTELKKTKEREGKLQKNISELNKRVKEATNGSAAEQEAARAAKAAQATAEAELNKAKEDAIEANEKLEKSKEETKAANDEVSRLTESLKSKETELARAQQPRLELSQRAPADSNSPGISEDDESETSSVRSVSSESVDHRSAPYSIADRQIYVLGRAMGFLESDNGIAGFKDSATPILNELDEWNKDEDKSEKNTRTHINNVNRIVCQCQLKDVQTRLVELDSFINTETGVNVIMQLFNYDQKSDVITWNAWGNLVQRIIDLSRDMDESSFNEAPFFPNFSDVVWHDKMPGFRPCRGDESELKASQNTLLKLLKIIAQSTDQQKMDFLQKPYVGISTLTEGAADMPLVATRQDNDDIIICHELSDRSKIDYMKTFRMNGNIYNTLQHVSNSTDDAIQNEILRQASKDDCLKYLNVFPIILPSYIDSDKLDIGQFFGMFLTPGRRLQLDEKYMSCIQRILFQQNQEGSLKISVKYQKFKIEEGNPSYIPNPYDQETGMKREDIKDFIEKIFTAGIYGNDRPTVSTFILNDILKTTRNILTKLQEDMGIFCNADTRQVKVQDSKNLNENSNILQVFTQTNGTDRLQKKKKADLQGHVWVDLGEDFGRSLGTSSDGKGREINAQPVSTDASTAEISAAPTAMPTSAQCFPTCSPTPYASPPMHFCGVCAPCQDFSARMAYGRAPPGPDCDHNPFRAPAAGEAYGQYRAPSVTPLSCVPPQMGYRPQQMVRGCPPMAPQGACTYIQCPPEMPWMPVHAGGVRGIDRRAYYVGLGMH